MLAAMSTIGTLPSEGALAPVKPVGGEARLVVVALGF